jgi:hypothetical protein
MIRRNLHRNDPTAAQSRTDADTKLASERLPRQERPEMLDRLAVLVANGECSLPDSLSVEERNRLLARVADLRRERLIRYIAGAIASDIYRSREVN